MKKDKYLSEDHKRKISEAMTGENNPFKGKHHSKKSKDKMSESHEGHIGYWNGKYRTLETKRKIGESMKGKPSSLGMLGKHCSEKTKKKMSEAQKAEKHWNWQGGISFEPYGIEFNNSLRKKIKKRDNHTCQLCGITKSLMDVHHIDYNKQNNEPENLITLCHSCNSKVNFTRGFWAGYFDMAEKTDYTIQGIRRILLKGTLKKKREVLPFLSFSS